MMHVYLDESGTHDGSQVLTMAGYIMAEREAQKFSKEWAKVLRRFDVPFGHMSELTGGSKNFRKLDLQARDKFNRLLISITRRRTVLGFAINLSPDHYEKTVSTVPGAPSAYSFCVLASLNSVSKWAERNSYRGRISYFFEAGHKNQGEAHSHMTQILESERLMDWHRYKDHHFLDKRDALPLQAADMIAWHSRHFHRRFLGGQTRPRRDFAALVREQDHALNYTQENLLGFQASLEEIRRNRGQI